MVPQNHSCLRAMAGFMVAARQAWIITVVIPINNASKEENRK